MQKWNSATGSLCLQKAKHWLNRRKNMWTSSLGLLGSLDSCPKAGDCHISHAWSPWQWGWCTNAFVPLEHWLMNLRISLIAVGLRIRVRHTDLPRWVSGSSRPPLLQCEADNYLPGETAGIEMCTRWCDIRRQNVAFLSSQWEKWRWQFVRCA